MSSPWPGVVSDKASSLRTRPLCGCATSTAFRLPAVGPATAVRSIARISGWAATVAVGLRLFGCGGPGRHLPSKTCGQSGLDCGSLAAVSQFDSPPAIAAGMRSAFGPSCAGALTAVGAWSAGGPVTAQPASTGLVAICQSLASVRAAGCGAQTRAGFACPSPVAVATFATSGTAVGAASAKPAAAVRVLLGLKPGTWLDSRGRATTTVAAGASAVKVAVGEFSGTF